MRQMKQVFLGAALLTAAFFVGSQFSGHLADSDNKGMAAEDLLSDDLVWHAGSSTSAIEAPAERPSNSAPAWNEYGAPPPRHTRPRTDFHHPAPSSLAEPPPLPEQEVSPSFANRRPGSSSSGGDAGLAQLDRAFSPSLHAPPDRDRMTWPQEIPIDRNDAALQYQWPGAAFTGEAPSQALPASSGELNRVPAASGLTPLALRAQRQIQLVVDTYQLHVVRPGETLPSIAQQYFGSPDYYLDIYLANQDTLSSPASLSPGQHLKIPK